MKAADYTPTGSPASADMRRPKKRSQWCSSTDNTVRKKFIPVFRAAVKVMVKRLISLALPKITRRMLRRLHAKAAATVRSPESQRWPLEPGCALKMNQHPEKPGSIKRRLENADKIAILTKTVRHVRRVFFLTIRQPVRTKSNECRRAATMRRLIHTARRCDAVTIKIEMNLFRRCLQTRERQRVAPEMCTGR